MSNQSQFDPAEQEWSALSATKLDDQVWRAIGHYQRAMFDLGASKGEAGKILHDVLGTDIETAIKRDGIEAVVIVLKGIIVDLGNGSMPSSGSSPAVPLEAPGIDSDGVIDSACSGQQSVLSTEVVLPDRPGTFNPLAGALYVQQASDLIQHMIAKNVLVKSEGEAVNGDYGLIPGSKKPSLFKSGAEKLCAAFGIRPVPILLPDSVSDWKSPLFYFHYQMGLFRISNTDYLGAANGSCNSMEDKYAYRWVPKHLIPASLDSDSLEMQGGEIFEFDFSLEKRETTGKYGKPESYWQQFDRAIADSTARRGTRPTKNGDKGGVFISTVTYRIPNPEVFSLVNTIDKMAQKRALIAAVLVVTGASRFFTQDIEDIPNFGTFQR